MDALTDPAIGRASPDDPALDLLFARHVAAMHADTPPESIHMLPRADLAAPGIAFYVMRGVDQPIGMGAIKRIGPAEGEVKSMHILAEHRGAGLSHRLLAHLIAEARAAGFTRLSLETGAQPTYAAARALYAATGFAECAPFGDYRPDPHSVFMTRAL